MSKSVKPFSAYKPFPEKIDEIIRVIGIREGLRISSDTHHEANNRELSWFQKDTQKRVNFEMMGDYIEVTFSKEVYPVCPTVMRLLHKLIPSFTYFAKIQWEMLDQLKLDESTDFYDDRIASYIKYAKK